MGVKTVWIGNESVEALYVNDQYAGYIYLPDCYCLVTRSGGLESGAFDCGGDVEAFKRYVETLVRLEWA